MVRKPFDIETLWFTELLEAIGQPNGLNCEHHKCLRTNAGIRKSRWSRRSGSDLFMSQTDSSMPAKSGCLNVVMCCQIVSSSEVLWLFFLFFLFFFQFSFEQSTAQCTCNRLIILTLTDHHCQLWLKKKLPSSPVTSDHCFPSPPCGTLIAACQAEEQSTTRPMTTTEEVWSCRLSRKSKDPQQNLKVSQPADFLGLHQLLV